MEGDPFSPILRVTKVWVVMNFNAIYIRCSWSEVSFECVHNTVHTVMLWEYKERDQDSSVGIATSYGQDDLGSIPGMTRCFSSPQRPDWLWGPPSLLPNGYQGRFPHG
jgi:hypothetical protein